MNEQRNTYSVALRVRRITYEDAYVAVPLTDAITHSLHDGTTRINPEAFIAEGIRISQDSRVEWKVESHKTEMHPQQRAAPEDRTSFDAFYHANT